MTSHYCIGTPCWICHPGSAPLLGEHDDFWLETIEDCKIPEQGISGKARMLIMAIFAQGLDEGTAQWCSERIERQDLQKERLHVAIGSLEGELLDAIINCHFWNHD